MVERVATVGAVGDIALCGPAVLEMQRRGTNWLLDGMRPVLARADVLFGNLECAILPPDFPDDEIDPRGLVSKFDGTQALKDVGFDVLSLANNHILDGGTTGLFHTAETVEARGMLAAGVGATQEEARRLRVLERAGLRWGFLCYAQDSDYALSTVGPCYAYYEPEVVLGDIARARPNVDVLVVSVHADLEFAQTPSFPRREAFRDFARAGATLVLGHHPHVPQGVERVGNSLVAYSLGNFVFHAHTSSYLSAHLPYTAQTFVLLVEVSGEGAHGVTRVPVRIARAPGQRPLPANGADADALTAYLDELDAMVGDDARVAANWRETAVRQMMASLRDTAAVAEPHDVLHTLGKLLHVAENRAWVDEVGVAVAEVWKQQRRHVDPYHRPGFVASGFKRLAPALRPLPLRVAARLRRAARAYRRRVRSAAARK
jgi:hypothetical protein